MLKITTTKDPTGRYYLADPAREVVDVTGAAPGQWVGRGALAFGLQGPVAGEQLASVLDGRPPGSTLRTSTRRTVRAYDFIVAAPKCVSILFADPDHDRAAQVIEAHHHALDVALSYIECRVACVRRYVDGYVEDGEVGGLLGARFTHGVSRSGDPHLHSHLLLANLARGNDGRFSSLDARAFTAHRFAIDALYRTELRLGIAGRLGVHWERDDVGREQLAEVSPATVATFSSRSAQLRGERRGWDDKGAWTRMDVEALWARRRRFEPALEVPKRRNVDTSFLDEHRFAGMLTQEVVRRRDLVAAWAEAAPAGIEAQLVDKAVSGSASEPGHGIFERPLLGSEFRVPRSLLRMLGPRPVHEISLEKWWRSAAKLERSRGETWLRRERSGASALDRYRGYDAR